MVVDEETEVRRARRSWPVQYKLDILAEIDEAKARGEPGAVGAICRREGLYSSLITRWRQQRDDGARRALVERPPGPRAPNRLTLERDRYRDTAWEQLTEGAIHELGRAEDVRDPDAVVEDVQGRQARLLRACLQVSPTLPPAYSTRLKPSTISPRRHAAHGSVTVAATAAVVVVPIAAGQRWTHLFELVDPHAVAAHGPPA